MRPRWSCAGMDGGARSNAWAVLLVLGGMFGLGCAVSPPAPDAEDVRLPSVVGVPAAESLAARPPSARADPLEEKNCIAGIPTLDPARATGVTIVRRRGYVLAHGAAEKEPLFVCEGIPRSQLDGPAQRRDNFQADPELPSGHRAELSDYKGSGFDRGHQAPAEDMTEDQQLMDESFYLSNMCPQVGVGFNQHIWADLEAWVRDIVRKRGTAYVITGPLFLDPELRTIGPGRVAVPSHFFKIVVTRDEAGNLQAIAFVLENRKHLSDDRKHLERFIRSIDWVEEQGKLDFMPQLSAPEEERLERMPAAMWN
jgi:endonuclease G